ncbi:MAG TPA: hypothetical protein VH762_08975 [Gemmatimonadaceae bacterium]
MASRAVVARRRSHCLTRTARPIGADSEARALGYGCWWCGGAGERVRGTLNRGQLLGARRRYGSLSDDRRRRKPSKSDRKHTGTTLRAGATALFAVALTFAMLGMARGVVLSVISVTVVSRGGTTTPC